MLLLLKLNVRGYGQHDVSNLPRAAQDKVVAADDKARQFYK